MNKLGWVVAFMGILAATMPVVFFAGKAIGQPQPRPAELDLLNGFIGEWDGYFGGMDDPKASTVKTSSEWVLGNMFVQSKGTIRGNDESHSMILWTYDVQKKVYRRWFYFSSGATLEEIGYYDAASKTFHFHNANPEGFNGLQSTSTVKVESDDAKSWTMEFSSSKRPPVKVMGTATRRK
ncbi:MAG: DUF1579 family protein [Planctomycetota bacterium]